MRNRSSATTWAFSPSRNASTNAGLVVSAMTLSGSMVPVPGSSHSGASSRRNRHEGRSSSGVSSTGVTGSASTRPAKSVTPASTRSTIEGRTTVGSNAAEISVSARSRSNAVATGCEGALPSIAPSAARSSESGSALSPAPSTRTRSGVGRAPPLSRSVSSGRIGTGRSAVRRSVTALSRVLRNVTVSGSRLRRSNAVDSHFAAMANTIGFGGHSTKTSSSAGRFAVRAKSSV
ncbi:hypothetical protein BH18ACT12_BH18ACT12_08970 [soil metagenome]